MASQGSMGTLSWSAKLDSNEFKKGVRRVKKEMKEAQKAVGNSLKMIAQGFTVATGAIAGMTVAMGAMVKQSAEGVRELENLSKVADTTFQDFQKMAFGAKKFGVEQDKLSDILKDVKDRVGDFISTGGGPMADFFENIAPRIGITADAFKDLSGKDALQLFYNSLEKANLSQAEMVFYMEAMASDLTLLQPLLADNGKLFDEMGRKAVQAGAVLPQDKVENLKKVLSGFDELSDQMTASIRNVSAELAPQITEILDDIKNILSESDVELKVLFDSLLKYFELTVDGMRFALENAGIIDEFYTWQDAFLDIAFFLQNTFDMLLLGIFKGFEKFVSIITFPIRKLMESLVRSVQFTLAKLAKGMSSIGLDTDKIEGAIKGLQDVLDKGDATSFFKAYDGAFSKSIRKELKEARKEFDKTVEALKKKQEEVKKIEDGADPKAPKEGDKDGKSDPNKNEGETFGGLFDHIDDIAKYNKEILGSYEYQSKILKDKIKQEEEEKRKRAELHKKQLEEEKKRLEKLEQERKQKIDDDLNAFLSRDANVMTTAGSVEEFNLMTAQRNQELDIAKKQLAELKKLNKDKEQEARFNG